jgi:hypothetical protein
MRLRRESLFLYGVLLRIGRGKFLCDGRGLREPSQQSEDQRPGEIKDDEGCSNHCVEARIPRQNIFIYIIDMERNNRPALPTWPVSPIREAEKNPTNVRKGFGKEAAGDSRLLGRPALVENRNRITYYG